MLALLMLQLSQLMLQVMPPTQELQTPPKLLKPLEPLMLLPLLTLDPYLMPLPVNPLLMPLLYKELPTQTQLKVPQKLLELLLLRQVKLELNPQLMLLMLVPQQKKHRSQLPKLFNRVLS